MNMPGLWELSTNGMPRKNVAGGKSCTISRRTPLPTQQASESRSPIGAFTAPWEPGSTQPPVAPALLGTIQCVLKLGQFMVWTPCGYLCDTIR